MGQANFFSQKGRKRNGKVLLVSIFLFGFSNNWIQHNQIYTRMLIHDHSANCSKSKLKISCMGWTVPRNSEEKKNSAPNRRIYNFLKVKVGKNKQRIWNQERRSKRRTYCNEWVISFSDPPCIVRAEQPPEEEWKVGSEAANSGKPDKSH